MHVVRMTPQRLAVMQHLVDGEALLYEIARATGLTPGSVTKITTRLIAAGFVRARGDDTAEKRRGRLYSLTRLGSTWARRAASRDTPGRLTAASAACRAGEIIDSIDWSGRGSLRGSQVLEIVRQALTDEGAWE